VANRVLPAYKEILAEPIAEGLPDGSCRVVCYWRGDYRVTHESLPNWKTGREKEFCGAISRLASRPPDLVAPQCLADNTKHLALQGADLHRRILDDFILSSSNKSFALQAIKLWTAFWRTLRGWTNWLGSFRLWN
jgi:hypothetical protein